MSRPLPMPLPVPSWATTPDSPNIPPDADQRLDGWVPGEKPPAQVFNYIQKEYYDWIRYLDDMSTQFDAFREGAQSNPVTNAASAIATGLPAPIMVQSSAQGTGSTLAKNDHRHPVSIGVPVDIGSSNAEGTATSLSRSDHQHAHGPLVQYLLDNRIKARGTYRVVIDGFGTASNVSLSDSSGMVIGDFSPGLSVDNVRLVIQYTPHSLVNNTGQIFIGVRDVGTPMPLYPVYAVAKTVARYDITVSAFSPTSFAINQGVQVVDLRGTIFEFDIALVGEPVV